MSIQLPKIFQQKDIEYLTQGKGNPEWEKYIGKNKISYSDLNIFTDETYSDNSLRDFVLQRFLNKESEIHPEFANFGKCVEDYICTRNENCGLSKEEMQTLDQIEPLGNFQEGFVIDFDDFVLVGLSDDYCDNKNICEKTRIRDYKTASKSSFEKRYKNSSKNIQLSIYALHWFENKGFIPDILELVCIEREGNPFKGEKLLVGKNIWIKEFTVTKEELLLLKEYIKNIVTSISEYYRIFKIINQ